MMEEPVEVTYLSHERRQTEQRRVNRLYAEASELLKRFPPKSNAEPSGKIVVEKI